MNRTEIQNKIVENLPIKPHGLLKYAPRVGKSRILCGTIQKNKPEKVLWVTVTTELRDVDIPKEIKLWLGDDWLSKIETICYPSLSNLEGEYDMIILDEYQDITELNTQNLLNGKIKYEYILGATGTHPKHFNKKQLLRQLNLYEIDMISIDEAVELDLIAPYKIITVPIELDNINKTILAGSKNKPFYQSEKANYDYLTKVIQKLDEEGKPSLYTRIKRRNLISKSKSKLDSVKKVLKTLQGRTIIFSIDTETSKLFSKNLYNSKTDSSALEAFKKEEINILSLVNKGGVGHTYKNVQNFIITQVDTDKKGNTTQKIARSLLKQKDYIANIYIFYIKDTVDEEWLNKALKDFNPQNVIKMELNEFRN